MLNKHTLLQAKQKKRVDTMVFRNLRWASMRKELVVDMVRVRKLLSSKNVTRWQALYALQSYIVCTEQA